MMIKGAVAPFFMLEKYFLYRVASLKNTYHRP
jgi:hypothetical protein